MAVFMLKTLKLSRTLKSSRDDFNVLDNFNVSNIKTAIIILKAVEFTLYSLPNSLASWLQWKQNVFLQPVQILKTGTLGRSLDWTDEIDLQIIINIIIIIIIIIITLLMTTIISFRSSIISVSAFNNSWTILYRTAELLCLHSTVVQEWCERVFVDSETWKVNQNQFFPANMHLYYLFPQSATRSVKRK